ncbi:hypothetical protein J3F84DRAFT_315164 [Trichoderma pleuroticola]
MLFHIKFSCVKSTDGLGSRAFLLFWRFHCLFLTFFSSVVWTMTPEVISCLVKFYPEFCCCAVLSSHAYSKPHHLPLFSLFARLEFNVKFGIIAVAGSNRGVYRLEFSSLSFNRLFDLPNKMRFEKRKALTCDSGQALKHSYSGTGYLISHSSVSLTQCHHTYIHLASVMRMKNTNASHLYMLAKVRSVETHLRIVHSFTKTR